jgi:hypothetical protein
MPTYSRCTNIEQALQDLRFESTYENADINDAQLDATMAFLDVNGDDRISLEEFKHAVRMEESARKIVRRWKNVKTRVGLRKLVENTAKWINFPTADQMEKFLFLTNGTRGQYNEEMVKEEITMGHLALRHRAKSFTSLKHLSKLDSSSTTGKPAHANAKYSQVANAEAMARDMGPRPWCGTFEADGASTDVKFLTVNVPKAGEAEDFFNSYNPHLIRYYLERVWNLNRPDVIITVTGGAMAFDMSTEDKDKIMKGMMDGTRNLDAWFITGGTKSGIMEVFDCSPVCAEDDRILCS